MSGVTASNRVNPVEGEHLAQPVDLDDRATIPSLSGVLRQMRLGQPPRVEVRIDRHVVAEPLGNAEERVELDLLDRPLRCAAALERP